MIETAEREPQSTLSNTGPGVSPVKPAQIPPAHMSSAQIPPAHMSSAQIPPAHMSIAQPSVQAIASNPALAPVLAAVRTAQARYRLFPLPDSNQAGGDVPVVVGVSGGADSLCLLYALVALAQ